MPPQASQTGTRTGSLVTLGVLGLGALAVAKAFGGGGIRGGGGGGRRGMIDVGPTPEETEAGEDTQTTTTTTTMTDSSDSEAVRFQRTLEAARSDSAFDDSPRPGITTTAGIGEPGGEPDETEAQTFKRQQTASRLDVNDNLAEDSQPGVTTTAGLSEPGGSVSTSDQDASEGPTSEELVDQGADLRNL